MHDAVDAQHGACHVLGEGAARHRPEHVDGDGDRTGAKENPGQHHRQESRRRTGQPERQVAALPQHMAQCMVDDQVGAMQHAPHDKGPVRAMPQAAQQHGQEQVAVALESAVAVAAQRDIQIVAQEARQRDVPAAPEVDDRGGFVGRIEIDRQDNAKHVGQAIGHVGIGRKIEIQLEGVGQRPGPGFEHAQVLVMLVEHGADKARHAIGKDDLLEQADGKESQPHHQPATVKHMRGRLRKLRHHLLVMQDGTGDQVRKIGDEQAIAFRLIILDLAGVAVDQVGNLGKGEKRYADRQDDAQRRDGRARHGRHIAEQKIGIFEKYQQRQIEDQAGHQPALGRFQAALSMAQRNAAADGKVGADRQGQQRQEGDIPITIKSDRGKQQENDRHPQ